MTVKDAYTQGRAELEQAGISEADLDAWYLLEYVTGISRTVYYADPEKELAEEEEERYRACLEKRKKRIPLQHITGIQEFMGLPFSVNEHVLIPRQDTETLVEEALKLMKHSTPVGGNIRQTANLPMENGKMRILDMCTGSGCILLSVLYYAGKLSETGTAPAVILEGIGSDISEAALSVAKRNADALGIKAEFTQGDLFENISGRFAVILSNPPYIRTKDIEFLQEEVKLHDPRGALDGKEDGLYFYRCIIRKSADYLLPKGYLMFEIGYDQAEDVGNLMSEAGYIDITVKKDLAGLDRVVYGRYIR